MGMPKERRYPEKELSRVEGGPMPPARLAQIWHTLPEAERLAFLHSLIEQLADEVMAATVKKETQTNA
jgi:hypothetical protein